MVSKMNTSRMLVVGGVALLLWMSEPPSASSSVQQLELWAAGTAQMVQREPGEPTPFFRMDLHIVDERRSPISVVRPNDEKELKKSIEINVKGNGTFHPFYVDSPKATAERGGVGREVMLVIDVSGSMTQPLADGRTRFQAAKDAAGRFLHNFQDGVDHISIVPFESHRVVERIKGARFVNTTAEARQQIEDLPQPKRNYNTALYSATVAALEVLEGRKASQPSQEFMLIILTDGKNDVKSGGNPGLLDGSTGLRTVLLKAREVGIPIYTVGFGKPGDLDEASLRAMAWPSPSNYFPAPDADRLEQALQGLKGLRRVLIDRLRITFPTDHQEWSMLKGLTFMVRFKLPHGRWIESPEIPWLCQPMTGCPPEGTLTEAEIRALLEDGPIGNGKTFREVVLRRLGILALFSSGLAALWFIPPRLLWTRPRLPRPSGPMGANIGQPRVPTVPGKSAFRLRPQAPRHGGQSPQPSPSGAGRGGQGQPPRPRQRFEETIVFRNQGNGSHTKDEPPSS